MICLIPQTLPVPSNFLTTESEVVLGLGSNKVNAHRLFYSVYSVGLANDSGAMGAFLNLKKQEN